MACAIGGMVYIDFENEEKPQVEKIDADFEKAGLTLCIVDTKGSHAGLTHEYAQIPVEMKQIAAHFGKNVLREVEEKGTSGFVQRIRRPCSTARHTFFCRR